MDHWITIFSCKRNFTYWPMVLIYNMLDVAGIAGYLIWLSLNPDLKKNMVEEGGASFWVCSVMNYQWTRSRFVCKIYESWRKIYKINGEKKQVIPHHPLHTFICIKINWGSISNIVSVWYKSKFNYLQLFYVIMTIDKNV